MVNNTTVINGVTVRDITPPMTPEESAKRATEVAMALLDRFGSKTKDKDTA